MSWSFSHPSNEMWEREKAGFSQGVSPRGLHCKWLTSKPGEAAAEEAEEVPAGGEGI